MTSSTVSMLPPGAGGRVLDFRRRGTPPRRRRRSFLVALLRPLLAACLLVALPSGLVAWVLTAPPFQLQAVEVKGASPRVSDGWVQQALAPFEGENLVALSLADAASRVRRNPWISSVEMVKELPDRLRVQVAERKPVALLLTGGSLVYADEKGDAIAPVATPAERDQARAAGLLVVSFAHESHETGVGAALEVAAELGRVQPTWAAKLERIEVLGEEDFRLWTEPLPFPLLVTRGHVGPKVQRLVELLPELSRRYPRIEAVDLRFSRRIVVQPAPAGNAAPPGDPSPGYRTALPDESVKISLARAAKPAPPRPSSPKGRGGRKTLPFLALFPSLPSGERGQGSEGFGGRTADFFTDPEGGFEAVSSGAAFVEARAFMPGRVFGSFLREADVNL